MEEEEFPFFGGRGSGIFPSGVRKIPLPLPPKKRGRAAGCNTNYEAAGGGFRLKRRRITMTENNTLIHAYTREQAVADGVLIDVTETAREAGFRIPVAVTSAAWGKYVEVPPGVAGQDERGRLWDVLWMLLVAIRRNGGAGAEIRYRLHVRNDNRDGEPPLVELKAMCGPGDDGAPCVTVMLPDED